MNFREAIFFQRIYFQTAQSHIYGMINDDVCVCTDKSLVKLISWQWITMRMEKNN